MGCRPRLITQPSRPAYVPYSLRPAASRRPNLRAAARSTRRTSVIRSRARATCRTEPHLARARPGRGPHQRSSSTGQPGGSNALKHPRLTRADARRSRSARR
jgi:hypothetical protein